MMGSSVAPFHYFYTETSIQSYKVQLLLVYIKEVVENQVAWGGEKSLAKQKTFWLSL